MAILNDILAALMNKKPEYRTSGSYSGAPPAGLGSVQSPLDQASLNRMETTVGTGEGMPAEEVANYNAPAAPNRFATGLKDAYKKSLLGGTVSNIGDWIKMLRGG